MILLDNVKNFKQKDLKGCHFLASFCFLLCVQSTKRKSYTNKIEKI